MLMLDAAETAALIDRDDLRRVVGVAMAEVSAGRVSMPARVGAFRSAPWGVMAAMPAHVPALDAMATKVVNVFPANADRGLPTHQAVVLVVDPDTGGFVAMLDGDVITAERTAAGSALSTDLLARADSRVLAIIGTGVQARSHALAVPRVRAFTQIRIAGRDERKAGALAAEIDLSLDALPGSSRPELVVAASYEEACVGADVVCATTDSPEPVVQREWLSPGSHVTSIGFSAHGPEIDGATVAASLLVVESRATAFAGYPVGPHDLAQPLAAGLIGVDHVAAELGELVLGVANGRASDEQLTLYKSAGVAAQDVAAAKLIHDAAVASGAGTYFQR